MLEIGQVITLDTDWLYDNKYSHEEIKTGEIWIWAIDPETSEIVYFEKERAVFADSDDYPTVDDEIYKVVIHKTWPFVEIRIVEALNLP